MPPTQPLPFILPAQGFSPLTERFLAIQPCDSIPDVPNLLVAYDRRRRAPFHPGPPIGRLFGAGWIPNRDAFIVLYADYLALYERQPRRKEEYVGQVLSGPAHWTFLWGALSPDGRWLLLRTGPYPPTGRLCVGCYDLQRQRLLRTELPWPIGNAAWVAADEVMAPGPRVIHHLRVRETGIELLTALPLAPDEVYLGHAQGRRVTAAGAEVRLDGQVVADYDLPGAGDIVVTPTHLFLSGRETLVVVEVESGRQVSRLLEPEVRLSAAGERPGVAYGAQGPHLVQVEYRDGQIELTTLANVLE